MLKEIKGNAEFADELAVLNKWSNKTKAIAALKKQYDKKPFARIGGNLVNRTDKENYRLAQQYIDDPEWTQVGFNPMKHSYFFDRKTGDPVTGGEEAIQVGPLVLVKNAVKFFPKKVSVGLDLLKDKVAIKGWTKTVEARLAEYYFKKFSDLGVESIIYTDIDKDGVLKGPNIKKINYYKKITSVPLVASGGVSSLEDIINLKKNNIYGVIVGKAIYEKKVDLKKIFYLNNHAKT